MVLGNWQSLAQKLGVTFTSLKMLQEKSYSNREAARRLFWYLYGHPSMTVKILVKALAKMKRDDVAQFFQKSHCLDETGKFDG